MADEKYLSIVSAGSEVQSVRRVRQTGHGATVSLLLQHVRFALPFPNQKLATSFTTERDPVTDVVERD